MITLLVTYRIKPGEEAPVEMALREMARRTRAEPGNLAYQVLRSEEEPRKIVLFEQYTDQAALDAHSAADYFKELVLATIVPRLETRVREQYKVLGQ